MSETYHLLLVLHVAIACVALSAFWVAALARKGAGTHRGFGRVFVYSMTGTAISAAALSLMLLAKPLEARPPGPEVSPDEYAAYGDTLSNIGGGLFEVSLATGALLYFGWTALRRRGLGAGRARPAALLVAGGTIAAGALLFLLRSDGVLLAVVGGLELRALLRRERRPRAWLAEHLAGMLGAGAFANGAFAVNIARHFTEDVGLMFLPGGVVGLIFAAVIAVLARKVHRGGESVARGEFHPRPSVGMTPRPGRA